jgi:hypothetical protein
MEAPGEKNISSQLDIVNLLGDAFWSILIPDSWACPESPLFKT